MDTNSLSMGEKIAGAAGAALLIIMFIGWWGPPDEFAEAASLAGVDAGSANAWQAADFLDLIWALTALAGIALAVMAMTQANANLPVAMSALVAGLGLLSTVTILYRLLDTPFDSTRKIGVFLGLIAAAGVAYGGWMAMQEEGTSFSDQADRLQGDGNPPPAA